MNTVFCCIYAVAFSLACASASADPSDFAHPSLDAQIDYILDNPLQESEYVKSNRCIGMQTYRSVEVLDARHLLFLGKRGAVWLNRLRSNCVGLEDDSMMIFEAHDQSLCDMDGFRSTPRNAGSIGFGSHCMLGHFEPISESQADVLRDAFARRANMPVGTP
jgi:hypothetical protein